MKGIKAVAAILLVVLLFTSCSLLLNSGKYKGITQDFTDNMLNARYDNCLSLFALDNPAFKGTNPDTLKKQLVGFRKLLVDNFGTKLDYSFIQAKKTYSTEKEDNTPPNTTDCLIQFSNGKDFGELQVLFDDKSNKIINIHTLDVKQPVPSMTTYWLTFIFPLAVLLFNIYTIVKVKRSNVRRKWLYYLSIIILNIPTIIYSPVNGLSLQLLNFQIMLGFSFQYMGYGNTFWAFGVPIGAIIALIRIKNNIATFNDVEGTEDELILPENDPDNVTQS